MLPGASIDATIESTIRFIWTTAVPRIAGNISLSTLFTPEYLKFTFGVTSKSILYKNGNCIKYCINPANRTPYANAIMGVWDKPVEYIAALIRETFNRTGVIEGRRNLSYVLNIPAYIAVSEIKNK